MADALFSEKTAMPDDDALRQALGRSFKTWNELRDRMVKQYDLTVSWSYGGKKYGWSLKLSGKKRAAFYMIPDERHFRIGMAYGEKAVEAALRSDLPEEIKEIIVNAPKYPEGRAVRLPMVKTAADVRFVEQLVAIKMTN